MKFIYNLAIAGYAAAIRLAALFNKKAALFVKGRQHLFQQLETFSSTRTGHPVIWLHCASLGEFEQGRPVIEKIKEQFPHHQIALTFFSPSGYELRKDYALADLVCYLPMDQPGKASRFVQQLNPDLAIFVKYEFWINHLRALRQNDIPVVLISAVFRKEQLFFKPYGNLFLQELKAFDQLFIQDEASARLLEKTGIEQYTIAGDTRIDRVIDIAQNVKNYPNISDFCAHKKILICGSTWGGDEDILLPFINEELATDWKAIIAPHDIRPSRIAQIAQKLTVSHQRYSQLNPETIGDSRVLIIDNIGMLSALYQYGTIAYIGGGFGVGIHNTLEPMAFEVPVIFGPKFEKFIEAREMTSRGGAFSIDNAAAFREVFQALQLPENYQAATAVIRQFLQENQGSTKQIVQYLSSKILAS